jgi:4-hydroxy-tetrahydrodipicolinate synthase
LLSGDDATALAFIGQGGNGCISVTSNVAPGLCRAMYLALKQGQSAHAQHLAAVVARLTGAMFRESNPVPVKYALSVMKMMSPGVRLPLVELKDESKAEIDAVLAQVSEGYAEYMIGNTVGYGQRVRSFGRPQPQRSLAVVS